MKTYEVTIGGIVHTMQLDEDDAKRYGDKAVEAKGSAASANKSRGAKNKEA